MPEGSEQLAIKKKRIERPNGLAGGKTSQNSEQDTKTVRLVAQPPKAGEFAIYDEMIASGLTSKKAVLAMIGKGFEKLDANALKPVSYECEGEAIETNRIFRVEDLSALKEEFDPFGILSKRAIGKKIGEALLAKAIKEMGNG